MDVISLRRKLEMDISHSHLVGEAGEGADVLTRHRSAECRGVTNIDVDGEPQCKDGLSGMVNKLEEESNMLQQGDVLAVASGCELGCSQQVDTKFGYWQGEYPMGVEYLMGITGIKSEKIARGMRDNGDTVFGDKNVAIENGATVNKRGNGTKGVDDKNADNVGHEGLVVVNENNANDMNGETGMRDSSKTATDCARTGDVLPDENLVFTSTSSELGMKSLLNSDVKQALPLTNLPLHLQRTEVISKAVN